MRTGGYLGDPEITGEVELDLGLRKQQLREPFLKGPLPLRELAPIAKMPGKTLALWLLIRHRSDLNRGGRVTLPQRVLLEWGIGKNAKTDALRRLEQAGLVTVERPKGYMLKVRPVLKRKRR